MKDYAEIVRLPGLTRARLTQIANLLLPAPDIQEAILVLSRVTEGGHSISERDLRQVYRMTGLIEQRCV